MSKNKSQSQESTIATFKSLIKKFKGDDTFSEEVKQLNIKQVIVESKKSHLSKTGKIKCENTSKETKEFLPLKDILKFEMDIMFIGINPGAQSSSKNRHFAGLTNAFWPCLFESDDEALLEKFNFGFTNLVARPSNSSSELTRREVLEGIPVLQEKISKFRPKIACFLGKQTFEFFTKTKKSTLGLQKEPLIHFNQTETTQSDKQETNISKTYLFSTPSTSGRAATFSRQEKFEFFVNLKNTLDIVKKGNDPITLLF